MIKRMVVWVVNVKSGLPRDGVYCHLVSGKCFNIIKKIREYLDN